MKKKKWLIVLAVFLAVWICFFTTDFITTRLERPPIFSVPVLRYKDGGSVEYFGLGYKVRKQVHFDFEKDMDKSFTYHIGIWFMKLT